MPESNFISLSEAQALTFAYQAESGFTSQPRALRFSKQDIQTLLGQEDAVALCLYLGLTSTGKLTLVAVTVDEDNQDMVDSYILDRCYSCPPDCSQDSPLIDQ
ncbi:MAG TPA: hypothetical protein P5550_05795 [Bacteroidales bacterium]|nr:hypothetical protein [Bacteroidales bacterium]HRZ76886.1 hypothetical protein [Bacteroidales bacterium]